MDGSVHAGDWIVVGDEVVEVLEIRDGVMVVRADRATPAVAVPQPPAVDGFPLLMVQSGWAPETAPVTPQPQIVIPLDAHRQAQVDQIAEAMRLARANPGREVVFGVPPDEPEG